MGHSGTDEHKSVGDMGGGDMVDALVRIVPPPPRPHIGVQVAAAGIA